MDENPTTGYQWLIPEEVEGFNMIWSLESSDFQPSANNGMVGVGGVRTFVLAVNSPGTEHLTFVYGRPWLYNNAMEDYRLTGSFHANVMEGRAVQLNIVAN
mmetsp:Transcript_17076/g.19083  ORF Transcript_17076/g.19083 Transcript_17076/m.19083 type:complete len:101 (+) Transcript_17076:180-482(+)|eukprot:CAMPEP_0205816812 /NCGR_PEP_ID=MMETSP0205-20121125/23295_1 /ASSEMBLY_ACC=CAM_ASM_000278 /TAXON_ID=36767 /ORGANISM="Euplotes focardii, Strain TN1" /LENGTH=100 /DNA_ID=CAMNT_0053105923 /DNA_START=159 /DNA_END=461 /DNA_ORIENTATION=+